MIIVEHFVRVLWCSDFRLQLYDLIEHKVQGDGNCQVSLLPSHCFLVMSRHIRQLLDILPKV